MNLLVVYIYTQMVVTLGQITQEKCNKNIYERCTHQSEFSESELDQTRVWLQNVMNSGAIKPKQPACKKLFVRKDFKCMSEEERQEFVRVFRVMYENGVIERATDIHQRYWAEVHKSSQLGPWHTWMINELEKEMKKVNNDITMPYYNTQIEASEAHKSMVWKYFGGPGIQRDGFCVTDGMYRGLNTTRCVKRQWKEDGSIPALDGLESNTLFLQLGKSFWMRNFLESGLHFNTHLGIGGYQGDMSVDSAPFDIMFFLWHNYQMSVVAAKASLVGNGTSFKDPYGFNLLPKIDQETGRLCLSNIERDRLIYYNIPLIDALHLGFGQMCTIADQVVVAILQTIRNVKIVPTAVQRMPSSIKGTLFPKLTNRNFDPFSHVFEEVGDCNRECRPIPHFEPYTSTANGKRQLRRYAYDENLRADWFLILSQALHKSFINRLNRSGYCSPYVTK